jgi:hypothetical protein
MVRSIFTLAAVLSVATASLARDLVTPAVNVGTSTTVDCKLLNITSAPITAEVQLVEAFGPVLQDVRQTLAAGGTMDAALYGPSTTVFCRFVNASLSKFRGGLLEITGIGDGTNTILFPAQ